MTNQGQRNVRQISASFLTTPLNAAFLSKPFLAQTNWHVITGAPCSGKTTLVDQLTDKGFQTVPEVARQYFESELSKGRTVDEIREDQADLERCLKDMQLRIESELQTDDVTFFDLALPDCLTYCRVFEMDPYEIVPACLIHRYTSVFIFDRLPFRRNATLGPEDEITARFLDEWLERDYSALGYDVVRVPFLTPDARLAFVLDKLSKQRLL